jgi:NAD(P)H-nitrite reductase large subunit
VVAVCEAARPGHLLAGLPQALRHPGKLAEGARYAAALARARVPVLSGWSVSSFSASPGGPGGSVTVGNGARSRTFAVDVVAVSHGLIPSVELPRALGCRDEPLPGHPAALVIVDSLQQTSTPGVFACGELTGVGGAAKAEHEGTVAGYAAARHLGRAGAARAARAGRRFAVLLARLYPVPATAALPPDTIVCRCEEVTLAAVESAVAAGAADLRAVKGLTRCGMGHCQGRVCGPVAQLLVARLAGRPLAEVGDLHSRHIGVPVPLAALRTADNARSGGPA